MYDVVALGELLIDFTPHGQSEKGNYLFEQNPGGAPANVLVMLSKLKKNTAFIGKVGQDTFGTYLKNILNENDVETAGLVMSKEVNTTLAFVHLFEDGDRAFSFYRKPGADQMLTKEEVNYDLIRSSKVFHFGSLSLTNEPVREATLSAVQFAKEHGLTVSYDPNFRESLWKDRETAVEAIKSGLAYTDILKVSEEEFELLTNTTNLEQGTKLLMDEYDLKLVLVTFGDQGCFYRYKEHTGLVTSFKVNAVDTTGSGDAFFGAFLYNVLSTPQFFENLEVEKLEKAIRFANAAGALTATRKGGIPALPELEEILELVQE
ncbi:carbohydrate kinase family protein [Gracilibacillus dipsosauri]|uniref:carbohydrate kinase family protein n=1 Tax=Gracilibacillus dipsosauri TaxID=178340 RepID=UPI002409CCB6